MTRVKLTALRFIQGLTVEQAAVELLQEKQPSKQFVSVEDMAQSVLIFCLPSSNQITGTRHYTILTSDLFLV
jgi:enoyl-[acyl-carrier-protein] reductase (NADH)